VISVETGLYELDLGAIDPMIAIIAGVVSASCGIAAYHRRRERARKKRTLLYQKSHNNKWVMGCSDWCC
jgi:hypothetical protein